MASPRVEIDRRIRAERERTDREIAEIKNRTQATIDTIKRESEAREREMQASLRDLERRQLAAQERMQAEIVRELDRQYKQTQETLRKIKAETAEKLRLQEERMRREWEAAYKRLDERIRKIEDNLHRQIEHALETINEAKMNYRSTCACAALRRFRPDAFKELEELLNAAINDFNARYFVPAEGKATLMMAQSAMYVNDAQALEAIWQRSYSEAMRAWKRRRDVLAEMERGKDIEAAGLVCEDVHLKVWNENGWKRVLDILEEIRGELDQKPFCPLDVMSGQLGRLDIEDALIDREILAAHKKVVCYLYMLCLLDELKELILEDKPEWALTSQEETIPRNTVNVVLGSVTHMGQEFTIFAQELPDGTIKVDMTDGTYDMREKRERRLREWIDRLQQRMRGLPNEAGDCAPAMAMSGIGAPYLDGDNVCVTFNAAIPGSVFSGIHSDLVISRVVPEAGGADAPGGGKTAGGYEKKETKEG